MSGFQIPKPERLAAYTPPAKPAPVQQAPPRVAKTGPSDPPPPEEDTVADAKCMVDAADAGAPFVNPG